MSYKANGYRLPNQPYSKFGYNSNIWLPGILGKNRALLDGGTGGFLRSIATRASISDNKFANVNPATNSTAHFTRDTVNGLYVGWMNASLLSSGEDSVGTQTIQGLVEYPAGVFTPILWGTSTSVVAAPFTMPVGFAPVSIPANTQFNIRSQLQGSVNILFSGSKQKSTADSHQDGGTDMRNVVNNGSAITFPSIIAGYTNKRALLMIGDSRIVGLNNQAAVGNQGNTGDYQTAFSPTYGGTRYSVVGLTAANFSASHTMALLLAQYHTDVINNLGINDIIANTGTVAMSALINSNIALFTSLKLKVWLSTFQPANTSNNLWVDLAGQTPGVHDAVRVAVNTLMRTNGYPTASGFFEFANVVEHALNDGDWKFDGTANKYTADGAHLNDFSTPLIGNLLLP